MARPRVHDDGRVKVTVRVDPGTLAQLDAEADRLLVGRSVAVVMCIDLALDDLARIPGPVDGHGQLLPLADQAARIREP